MVARLRGESQHQRVGFGVPIGVADLRKHQARGVRAAGERNDVDHADVLHWPCLAAEPAAGNQVAAQHLFNRRARLAAAEESGVPAAAHLDLRRAGIHLCFGHLTPVRRFQGQPEEIVRRQREPIRFLPDWRETHLTEQLHRHEPAELRQVELHEL